MKYDYDILWEFIPTKYKENFIRWDNAYLTMGRLNIVGVYKVSYVNQTRAPLSSHNSVFEERISIPLSLYMERVKQKQRDTILNQIL